MAETSAGGCVRKALRSPASTRPLASASGTCSAASGAACASTRSSASATESKATALLPRAVAAGAAAAFLNEPDALDAHAAFDRFHHIVDGEAGDRYRGERLHLDAGLARDLYAGPHDKAGQLGVGRDVDLDLGKGEGMAERDQFVGA